MLYVAPDPKSSSMIDELMYHLCLQIHLLMSYQANRISFCGKERVLSKTVETKWVLLWLCVAASMYVAT